MSKIIYARTHADFLNQVFGTNYKQYMRGRWKYNDSTWVWMVYMDGKVRNDWRNRIVSNDEIWEERVCGDTDYHGEPEKPYRIVVRIVDTSRGREYHILGLYKFDFESCTSQKNVLRKIGEF